MAQPPITVVIPALNEQGTIESCLERLESQLQPGDRLLVVDGGSDDATVQNAEAFNGVEVVEEPGTSIGEARQRGAEEADTPVVATTDADARPPTDWMDRIRDHFGSDQELSVLWGDIEDRNGVPIRNLVGKFLTPFGGASGNNTAFRQDAFMQLQSGYPDTNFSEDFILIERLARAGKAVRDPDMVMEMDMDRSRYQTAPLIGAGATAAAAGAMLGGPFAGPMLAGAGVGLGGTELTYESATDTPLHHDQLGAAAVALSPLVGGPFGAGLLGTGTGMITHHLFTEGSSIIGGGMLDQTDAVCEVQEDGTKPVCTPPDDSHKKVNRSLFAAVLGGVIGGMSALRE